MYVFILFISFYFPEFNGLFLSLLETYPFQVSVTSEDQRAVDGKGIRRKLIDRLYQTYSSELSNKKFAYDGEKSLYTVGPLPQNKFHFAVVLEDSFAKRYSHLLSFLGLTYCVHLIFKLTFDSFLLVVKLGVLVVLRALEGVVNGLNVLFSRKLSRWK